MTECCERYGISRQTGYELVQRYRQEGEGGLEEHSRAAHRHPNQTAEAVQEQVLALRRIHPRWGPRKLKRRLEREQAESHWPAATTIGALLAREGLVARRKKPRRTPPYTRPFAAADAPNRHSDRRESLPRAEPRGRSPAGRQDLRKVRLAAPRRLP